MTDWVWLMIALLILALAWLDQLIGESDDQPKP